MHHTLTESFFPNRCPYCRQILEKNRLHCPDCAVQFPRKPYLRELPYSGICIAPFTYSDTPAKAINGLKFTNTVFNAASLGQRLAWSVGLLYGTDQIDLVTCVPLSEARQAERGYNQSELLAQKAAAVLCKPYAETTVKIRNNKIQHHLSPQERAENIKNVYEIMDSSVVKDKNVLLIDDICTTGATITECARIIKRSGAKSVYCAAAALVY